MAKFRVELDNGQKFDVEADTQPTPEEVTQYMSQQESTDKATPDQYLSAGERLSGGFRSPSDLEQTRETQRAERGLESGTPLEPTGVNLENLLDLPKDVLDAVGPAFPAIGQFIGGALAGAASVPTTGGTAAPMAIAGGGVAGAAGGEAIRQFVGEKAFGFDQGTVGERVGRITLEGAFGALGEGGSLAINKLVSSTKYGILKAANNLIEKQGLEGFARFFGKLAPNIDTVKTNFALEALKRGDKTVMSKAFADTDFALKFAKTLFFGADNNLAKQAQTLAKRPGAREPMKQLFKEYIGLSDEAFETIVEKGIRVNNYNDPKMLFKLSKNILTSMDDLFEKAGNSLKMARESLSKSAGAVDVTDFISQLNTNLSKELTNVGFLIDEGKGFFSLNPKFAMTSTGQSQGKVFSQLVGKFFGTDGGDVLTRAAENGDIGAVIRLLNKETSGRRTLFNVQNKLSFKEFISKLKNTDVQISSNEFKSLGKLSPQLAEYLGGLRTITIKVADTVGDTNIPRLTNAFSELANIATPLRTGTKLKNVNQVESILKRMSGTKTTGAVAQQGDALNSFLKENLGIDFIDSLKSFRAAKEVSDTSNVFGKAGAKQKIVNIMKDAFSENKKGIIDAFENEIDPFLPAQLRVAINAKRHTTAEALHKSAVSLLRARFLSNALFPTIGGLVGLKTGGAVGGVAGLGAGFALQNPALFRALLRTVTAQSGKQISQTAAKQVPREAVVGGTQLLRGLLGQQR